MARILYVDGTAEWRDAVRRALGGHHVDPAGSVEDAVTRLAGAGPRYDLAIVDLDLLPGIGTLGAELLDVLRARHPETRRMAIAAGPLAEPTRVAVVDRHRLEKLLVKTDLTAAYLRRVVTEALDRAVTPGAGVRRAELRRRYQQWRLGLQAELDARLRDGPGDAAVACRERFRADAEEVCRRIEAAATIRDTLLAADAFEHARARWADPGDG
jgi:CheY-like chemotaxis protein